MVFMPNAPPFTFTPRSVEEALLQNYQRRERESRYAKLDEYGRRQIEIRADNCNIIWGMVERCNIQEMRDTLLGMMHKLFAEITEVRTIAPLEKTQDTPYGHVVLVNEMMNREDVAYVDKLAREIEKTDFVKEWVYTRDRMLLRRPDCTN